MLCFRCGSPVNDTAQTCDNCGQDLSSTEVPDREKFAELQKTLRQSGREWRDSVTSYELGHVIAERYEINDVVGAGALGTVYKAFDQEHEVDVALKVIASEHLPNDEARNDFLLALQRVRDLAHDNVVQYFDVDHEKDRCFYVMQFLKGLSLRKIIDMRRAKGQHFSVAEVEPIFVQLCQALQDTGPIMVHGGLKPENVIILPDLLKITDFGLAESMPRDAYLSAQRSYKDAVHYLAPEVVEKGDYDSRADIFSVGVILIELLTGKVHLPGDEVAIRDHVDEVPLAVDDVLQRAVARDPAQRQQSPQQLGTELAQAFGVEGVVAPASSVHPEREEPPEVPEDAGDEETTSRARVQQLDALPEVSDDALPEVSDDALTGERIQPDYSDPAVPPPEKKGSQVTHQLEVDDIEFASQSGRVELPGAGLDDDDDDEILTSAPEEDLDEKTARVDPNEMQQRVEDAEEELSLARPDGPPPERTQQIDADMIVEGPGEEEAEAEQMLLVPPGDINHSQISGETRPVEPVPEPADEPSYRPLVSRKDSAEKEARAREALQAFDFDATLQDAVEQAHQVEPEEPDALPPPQEEVTDPERPAVVTSEAGLSARGTLEVPAGAREPELDDEGQTMVVAQGDQDRPATTRLAPILIVAFILVLAGGTAGAIYYVVHKRSVDALRELEHKRALAMLVEQDAGVKALELDSGPGVAALPLVEDASAVPDAAAPAAKRPDPVPTPPPVQRPPPRVARPTPRPAPRPPPRVAPPVPRPAPPPKIAPAPRSSSGKCAGGLRHVAGRGGGEGFCIDRFESPGRGRTPRRTGLAGAKAACRARGLRLCTAKEWIRACGGLFPYGRVYDPKRCNTGGTALVPSGSKRRCRSRWGLYDMSGNVSEWVAEGTAMGGDVSASQGHAGCLSRSSGGGMTGFRCCGDTEWD